MKTLVIILSAIGLLSLNSCKQGTDSQALMESPETRTEVFNTITQNDDYMTEFMENMQGNNQAMQMMQGNKGMMNMMMKGEGMNIMKDSTMTMNMMHSMMKDGIMMNHMMQMMQNEGMMSEDCMQSSMKMMGDKGMNKGDMHN
jgi:hypothetical protein